MKYSRRATVEERKNIRTAVILVVLTVACGFFLFSFGLPSIVRFASFFSDLTKAGKPIETTDKTPPAPPRFDDLPDATNKANIDISGQSEPGATVTITINNSDQDVVAGSDGRFTINHSLWKGENLIWAKAKDPSGNVSQQSQTVKIIFDNETPKIDISSPADGATFYGSSQRNVTISGKTEVGASLLANGRFVNVNDDGSFSYAFPLSDGDNQITFQATDLAGNQTQKSITLHYSP